MKTITRFKKKKKKKKKKKSGINDCRFGLYTQNFMSKNQSDGFAESGIKVQISKVTSV